MLDDKQYALPVGLNTYAIIVNTDLLAKYKVALPDDATWTWDDLKTLGAAVSKASGGAVSGVQSWGFDMGAPNIWARQQGAAIYSPDGKVAVPPEVLAGFWQYLADLAKSGVAPAASVTVERANAALDQSGTATNKSVFATWWNTQLTSLATASGQSLKLLRLPGESTAKSPGAYYKPSMFWSVSSRSKHPAEAALFVNFLVNDQSAGDILLTERGVPANTRIRSGIAGKLSAYDKAAADFLDTVTVGESPRVTPNGASDVEAMMRRRTEEVLFGRQSPQDAATAFIKELQTAIDNA